jgi:hypothetical protein
MSRSLWLLLLAATGVSLGLVQGYSVAPRTAAWSGWTSHEAPNNRVSELVTCCWSQLDYASGGYCELFCGRNSGDATRFTCLGLLHSRSWAGLSLRWFRRFNSASTNRGSQAASTSSKSPPRPTGTARKSCWRGEEKQPVAEGTQEQKARRRQECRLRC